MDIMNFLSVAVALTCGINAILLIILGALMQIIVYYFAK